MRTYHRDHVEALCRKALEAGATATSVCSVTWNAAGRCENPHRVHMTGRPDRYRMPAVGISPTIGSYVRLYTHESRYSYSGPTAGGRWSTPLFLDIDAPCRKCRACLKRRARMWSDRAIAECAFASRTWFGTLTLSAQAHYEAWCRATSGMQADELNRHSDDGGFMLRHGAIAPEITRYLKRVRKESGSGLRFLLVAERHKSGLPHYHLLVHQQSVDVPILKRHLQDQWKLGFSRWKLLPPEPGEQGKAARYCAKYLSKGAEARVRASLRYGLGPLARTTSGPLPSGEKSDPPGEILNGVCAHV